MYLESIDACSLSWFCEVLTQREGNTGNHVSLSRMTLAFDNVSLEMYVSLSRLTLAFYNVSLERLTYETCLCPRITRFYANKFFKRMDTSSLGLD